MIHYETLRKKLIERRIELGMTQTDVACKIGIAPASFNGLENGTRHNPTTETLANWCRALQCHFIVDVEPYEPES